MKRILFASLASLAIATPAFARCDDNVSYAITTDGRCVDLTSFTNLGVAEMNLEDAHRQVNPILFKNLRAVRSPAGNTRIIGEAFNQSRRPLRGTLATLRLTRKVDGKVQTVKLEQIAIDQIMPAGKSAPVDWIILGSWAGTDVSVDDVTVAEMPY